LAYEHRHELVPQKGTKSTKMIERASLVLLSVLFVPFCGYLNGNVCVRFAIEADVVTDCGLATSRALVTSFRSGLMFGMRLRFSLLCLFRKCLRLLDCLEFR
jgi:hypothetical protein